MINLAIAEDNAIALQGLTERLSADKNIAIKCMACNGKELLRFLQTDHNVALVLMDLQMPEIDGIEATTLLKARYPQIKVLILTTFDDDDKLFKAILAGASGYILKEDTSTVLLQAIYDTLSGGAAMSPVIALKALQLIRNPLSPNVTKQEFDLTQREIELLEQLKNGLTYKEIADNLNISYHTVRKHIENIYRKLEVSNKVEALNLANNHRIV